jgi:hypothetical protein
MLPTRSSLVAAGHALAACCALLELRGVRPGGIARTRVWVLIARILLRHLCVHDPLQGAHEFALHSRVIGRQVRARANRLRLSDLKAVAFVVLSFV